MHFDEEFGVKDVTWIKPSGEEMQPEDWTGGTQCFGMLMDGRSQSQGLRERGTDATLLTVFNSHHEPVDLVLPPCNGSRGWRLLIDTEFERAESREFAIGAHYSIGDRSLLVFELLPESS